ncbi:hypothetical protein MPTK1_1g13400 [Marchantia polymorpha subsp. ruderalis]|uniref:COX assembly mitochondrial protein n=2 Tax=Marchantia polymorpha TaxID=3197 RepID=A0AAF6APQ3_MARPO|nr:hypothetical protein MARPO_0019s0110 [Marchantia polymorpha]BBM98423.1 hypothetical protein Mp_1g13400 [Marchantia polymorpha subsp. ruderalis]|eukprot:PTQ44693.1 hypothetical protein MARPO_0019s0110 [Marchantia polymorpha]
MSSEQATGLDIDEDRKRRCRGKLFALEDCQRKYRKEPERGMMCKHLNHAAALCLISCVCPEAVESVQYHCSSRGNTSKRQQCQRAQARLQFCIEDQQKSS